MNKIIFRWVKIMVLLYGIIGIALYYLQEKILFHPVALDRSYKYQFDIPFEEVEIPVNNTDTINMVKFFTKDSVPKGVVLYFHGNKGNINRYAKFLDVFLRNGYEVWMEDYPGYGKSTGERSERSLYRQAEIIYQLANSTFSRDSIILYGKSFGTGIAAYLASVKNCRQLILETPYYSIPDILGCYAPMYPVYRMIHYQIPTFEYLQEVTVPVTVFHGTDDGVIPYRCAEKLKQVLKKTDRFITIENGTHRDVNKNEIYFQKMDSILTYH